MAAAMAIDGLSINLLCYFPSHEFYVGDREKNVCERAAAFAIGWKWLLLVMMKWCTHSHFRCFWCARPINCWWCAAIAAPNTNPIWPIWTAQNTKCTILSCWIRKARETRISDKWSKLRAVLAEFWRLFLNTWVTTKKTKRRSDIDQQEK